MPEESISLSPEEYHEQLLKERDEFASRAQTPAQREEAAQMYTVPERLSRRGREELRQIIIKDELGEITLNVKTPSMHVILEVQEIQKLMRTGLKGVTVEGIEKLEDRLSHLLGEEVCADPELGFDFWKNGQYDPGLPWEIIGEVMKQYNRDMQRGVKFRGEPERKDAGKNLPDDGKETK